MKIQFKKLNPSAQVPVRAYETDAGYDLFASKFCEINPMERAIVQTDISVAIPKGYYGRVAPRSGLAVKNGIDVMAGVIDSSYRGPLGVVLINLNFRKSPSEVNDFESIFGDKNKFTVNIGDRIAQLIIEKCHDADFEEVSEFEETERSEGGFGSTGQ
jgi:dUTP pyrophosphatase